MSDNSILPRWVSIGVIPIVNLMLAFFVSGVIISFIGENPFRAISVMIKGAFYYPGAIGYTLYYTTNFIFTGLAVALAFHAKLFNIGGEGQAYIGGLGVGVVCLTLDTSLSGYILTDRSSWLRYQNKLNHVILYENPKELRNDYSMILINHNRCNNLSLKPARNLFNWLKSVEAADLIKDYQIKNTNVFYID